VHHFALTRYVLHRIRDTGSSGLRQAKSLCLCRDTARRSKAGGRKLPAVNLLFTNSKPPWPEPNPGRNEP